MKLAETPEEQRAWMAQWRAAEKALLEVKRQELPMKKRATIRRCC